METHAIEYVIEETALGALLVAATPRGVCLVSFGKDAEALTAVVRAQFPWATLELGGALLRGYARDIAGCAAGRALAREIPLDVRGSRFQERVWSALRAIPHGETRSYAVVAGAIGSPRAVRAVANACASNPVPLVVPCHRVVRTDGQIGGYRGGAERKRALLAAEAASGHSEAATTPSEMSAWRNTSTRSRLTPPSP